MSLFAPLRVFVILFLILFTICNAHLQDECGAIESVKAASEIYTPVSGKVTEVNKALEDKPALVNSSCYDEGWIFKLELKNPDELKSLMDEKQYEEFLKSSAH